jgi:HAD superfamily hydrolase (TIGR01509 family)
MKTILVDAVNTLIVGNEAGFQINDGMYQLLESFANKKIILTGANDEQFVKFGLHKMPYEVFTLKHNPEKTDPLYYKTMLEHFGLSTSDVVYFEHNKDAVASAQSLGIKTYHYNHEQKDLVALKEFLVENL